MTSDPRPREAPALPLSPSKTTPSETMSKNNTTQQRKTACFLHTHTPGRVRSASTLTPDCLSCSYVATLMALRVFERVHKMSPSWAKTLQSLHHMGIKPNLTEAKFPHGAAQPPPLPPTRSSPGSHCPSFAAWNSPGSSGLRACTAADPAPC